MIIYRLQEVDSEYNWVSHEIRINDHNNAYVNGELYLVNGTNINGVPLGYSFIGNFSIKFDLCSHWYFKGEDFKETDEHDSYYHICGGDSYIDFMTGIAFAVEVSKILLDIEKDDDLFDSYKVETLKLLEGSKIIRIDE